jgi:hypothetical protein
MAPKASSTFRPNSTDAVLARIMETQETQEKATVIHRAEVKAELGVLHRDLNNKLDSMKESQENFQAETRARLTVLEKETWTRSGRAAAAVFAIGFLSWFVPWYFAAPKK